MSGRVHLRVHLLDDDRTDVRIVQPSTTGTATPLGMTQEQVDAARKREANPLPFGFTAPAPKPKRARKK